MQHDGRSRTRHRKEVGYDAGKTEQNVFDPLRLPRKHLPQSDGGILPEGPGGQGGAVRPLSDRIGGDQRRRRRKSGLSPGGAQAARAGDRLQRETRAPHPPRRLRLLRSDRLYGPSQSAQTARHF